MSSGGRPARVRADMRAARGRPRREVLYGLDEIGDFFGVSHDSAKRWIMNEGLPASQAPDGTWMITATLIDKWLMSRHVAQIASQRARVRLRAARNVAIANGGISQPASTYYEDPAEQSEAQPAMLERYEGARSGDKTSQLGPTINPNYHKSVVPVNPNALPFKEE